jgi:hypothetical protein
MKTGEHMRVNYYLIEELEKMVEKVTAKEDESKGYVDEDERKENYMENCRKLVKELKLIVFG